MKGPVFVILFAIALTSGFDLRKDVNRFVNQILSPANNPKILISNGLTAEDDQFNFQVGLSVRMPLLTFQWCGGSLISPEWIVTAAHCTDKSKSITAYLGSTKQRAGKKVKVLKTIIHEGWNRTEAINDISLLHISAVTLGKNINIVKLPASSSSIIYPEYLDEKVIASGWGLINDEKETTENLQYAYLQTVPNSVCYESYGSDVRSSNICAEGSMGTSTCSGDSGGPLITESTKTLVGITSFADKKCTLGYPIVFTRITSYRSWISKQTGI